MLKKHSSSGISFRWNDLAVPEVLTGVLGESDDLPDEESESIVYDNLALPEIHFSARSGSASAFGGAM